MTMLKRLLRMLGFHVHEWGDWRLIGDIHSTAHGGIIGHCQVSECRTCHKQRSDKVWLVA